MTEKSENLEFVFAFRLKTNKKLLILGKCFLVGKQRRRRNFRRRDWAKQEESKTNSPKGQQGPYVKTVVSG